MVRFGENLEDRRGTQERDGGAAAPKSWVSAARRRQGFQEQRRRALKVVEARRSVEVEPRRPSPGRRRRVDVGSPRPSGRARR